MRIDVGTQTDTGRHKRNNEDYFGVFYENTPGLKLFKEGALLCVADGLGGHTGGEIASKLAVSIVKDVLKQPPTAGHSTDDNVLGAMVDWVRRANTSIYQTNQDHIRNGKPMGTTLLVSVVTPTKVYVANVGDSRAYLFRNGEIISRTQDHSWVDEQVKLGLMSKAEAESDARRNIVTRCIGTHVEVEVDTYLWNVVPGDMLLLCTDGLVNMVKDSDISAEFDKRSSTGEIAQRLTQMANENGGKDNITIIVAHISPSRRVLMAQGWRRFWRRHGATVLWLFLVTLMTVAGFVAGFLVGKNV